MHPSPRRLRTPGARTPVLSVLLVLLIALPLGACHWLRPYRLDVRQGTVVSGEMVAQLKIGMTPEQVRFVLGTPLLIDPFHADRWDYPNELRRGRSSEIERKLFSVFFKDGKLQRWEGDVLASTAGVEEQSKNRVVEIVPQR